MGPIEPRRRAALKAVTIDDVRQFHARHYRPNDTIMAVAGNFDWPRLCDEVEQLFGDWEPLDVAEPAARNGRLTGDHIPFQSNQSHVGIAYPTIPYKHPDYFQAWAAVGVLSSGSSSRLFTEVRERRGLCYTFTPRSTRSATGRACSATPAPRPNGPRKRST